MMKPSEIYDELIKFRKERDELFSGREIEQLNLEEQITLYGILSKIEVLGSILLERET